jgi:tryptophan-rich hypothetical protein
MNKFNPRKLKLSKWTACEPVNREKHFLVIQLLCDELGAPVQVELQAVHSVPSFWTGRRCGTAGVGRWVGNDSDNRGQSMICDLYKNKKLYKF